MVKGTLHAESLKIGAELSVAGLRLTRVSRRDVSASVSAVQPPVWTFLEFEADDAVDGPLADPSRGRCWPRAAGMRISGRTMTMWSCSLERSSAISAATRTAGLEP